MITENILHSFKCSIIQCSECGYQAANDVSTTPVLLTHVSKDVEEREMNTLVASALCGPDADCPNCLKKGIYIPMFRSTSPSLIEYPELLLITVGRYVLTKL